MVAIGVLLIIVSVICFASSTLAYGDIGISIFFTSIISLLCGIGFLVGRGRIKRLEDRDRYRRRER